MTGDPDRERREAVSEALLGRVDHHIIVAQEMESSHHITERIRLEEEREELEISLQITKGILESARSDLHAYEKDDIGGFSRGWDAGKDEVRKQCIEYLLAVGKELAENGESLSELSPIEGAIRKRAGWLFDDVAQMLFTDRRVDTFHSKLNTFKAELEEVIGKTMEDALAEIEELKKNDNQ